MNVCLEKATSGNRRLFEFRKKNISLTRPTFSLTRTGVREISCQNQILQRLNEKYSQNGSCLTQYEVQRAKNTARKMDEKLLSKRSGLTF